MRRHRAAFSYAFRRSFRRAGTVKKKKCGIAAFAGLERFSASRAGAVFRRRAPGHSERLVIRTGKTFFRKASAGTSRSGGMKSIRVYAFELQKKDFSVYASGVAGETAVRAHDAVTGDDDGNGIVPHGSAHGLSRHAFFMEGLGGTCGERFVGDGFTAGDAAELLPDELSERTSRRCQGQLGGRGSSAGKISVQPEGGERKHGQIVARTRFFRKRTLKVFLSVDPEADDMDAVADKSKRPDGREVAGRVEHGVFLREAALP